MLDLLLRQGFLLVQPLGFLWACLLATSMVLLYRRRWRLAAWIASLALALFLVGGTPLADRLLQSMERPYAGLQVNQLPAVDAVVMLGGGVEPSRYEAGGFHLTRAGDRVLMALEVMWQGKAPVLVMSGGGAGVDGKFLSEADLLVKWVKDRHLLTPAGANSGHEVDVISLGRCRDTHDEAVKVKALAEKHGWRRVLLVTSANHMRRASAAFRTQGIDVVPVPCNFLSKVSVAPGRFSISIPRFEGFEKAAIWVYEQAGWIEYRRRGWIDPAAASAKTVAS